MEIRILKDEYLKGNEIYQDFIDDKINIDDDHFTDELISLNGAPDFPIYMKVKAELRLPLYMEAFKVMSNHYLNIPREHHIDKNFWYSLLCTNKRDYLLEHYPEIRESEQKFRNIVLKKFDWENYIYKCILGAQYISDNIESEIERKRYYELIVNNLDLYNYIIKYEIFRNDKFLLTILDIVQDNNLSEILKAKVKGRPDLGNDPRVGRLVIFEMNKSYPVVLAPTLEKHELEPIFLHHLSKYHEGNVTA